MSIRKFLLGALVALAVLTSMPVMAQSGGGPQAAPATPGVGTASAVTLKVSVTISRWEGEKKVASAPYILMVVPSYGRAAEVGQDGDTTSVQMGAEVPMPSTTLVDGKPTSSYQLRTLGTNINVSARPVDGGRYNLSVGVNDSQLSAPPQGGGPPATPRYQTFRSQNRLTLHDGQTTQYAVATDSFTGQVIKLDVTMNVAK